MRYNKRAVSGVVTTLIIVALSIVAIGVVWKVILPMFTTGTQNIDYGAKCLEVNIKPTLTCAVGEECTALKLKRDTGTGDSEFDGVLAVFSGEDALGVAVEKSIPIATENIGVLETKEILFDELTDLTFAPTKVTVAVYFLKEDGKKYICPGTAEYTNA